MNINSTNIYSIGTNFSAKNNLNLTATNDIYILNAMDYDYEYSYYKKESFDIASAIANITTAIAVGALTGGAGAAAMAGVSTGTGASNMTKGSIEQSTEYHEKTLATNITGNNISITSGNDTTMISANINTENEVKYNISGELNISTATEQHISYYNKDEWGGDLSSVGRAMISGAITGAAVGYGMELGKFAGELAGNLVSKSVSGTAGRFLGAAANGATLASITTYTGSVGFTMSQTAINGGNLGDILESGGKSMVSEDTLKNVVIGAVIGGVGGALGEWIKDVKADYMKKTGNNVSTGESTIFDQKSVNSGWSDSKLGVNSEYKIDPTIDKNILVRFDDVEEIYKQTSYLGSNQNVFFKTLNLLPGSPSFVDFHDALSLPGHFNWMSIPPAYSISQFNALYPYYPYYQLIKMQNEKNK